VNSVETFLLASLVALRRENDAEGEI
jgi:hypothetical protein